MELIKVSATRRSEHGKGPARRLRREGLIPAVAYGKGVPAQALAVSPKEIVSVLGSEHGRNSVVELELDGGDKLTVLLSDFQYDPLSRALLHADFLNIALDQPVDVDVPLELTGRSAGVLLGGTLRQVFRKLPVRCLPEKIPVKIEHDITALELGESVAVEELALPEGVTIRLAAAQTVAAVAMESKGAEAEEAAAPGAPAAGTAETPAAKPEAPAGSA